MSLVPSLQLHLHGVQKRQINGDAWNFDLSEEYVNSTLCYLMAKYTNAYITYMMLKDNSITNPTNGIRRRLAINKHPIAIYCEIGWT